MDLDPSYKTFQNSPKDLDQNNPKELDPFYKTSQNNPKDLDLSHKTDLDFWGCFEKI